VTRRTTLVRKLMTDNPRSRQLSADCSKQAHGACSHQLGVGGGVNPAARRVQFGILLCHCECHAVCVLAGQATASLTQWVESCSCPGAQHERELWREAAAARSESSERRRADRQSRQDALNAVAAESRGKTREEVRGLLINEFRSRALDVPPDLVIESMIDSITLPGSVNSIFAFARLSAGIGGEVGKLFRLFKGLQRLEGPAVAPGVAPEQMDVLLNDEAEIFLRSRASDAGKDELVPQVVAVSLEPSTSEQPPQAVLVRLDGRSVGTLNQHDGLALTDVLSAANSQNEKLMMLGVYEPRSAGSPPRLRVYPSGPPRR
jgi:hypothetical protein